MVRLYSIRTQSRTDGKMVYLQFALINIQGYRGVISQKANKLESNELQTVLPNYDFKYLSDGNMDRSILNVERFENYVSHREYKESGNKRVSSGRIIYVRNKYANHRSLLNSDNDDITGLFLV